MSKRIEWIDVAKGILILLVILGHSDVSAMAKNFINSFHMAAFFFLSGAVFRFNGDVKELIRKRLKSIILPYLIFSTIMLMYRFMCTKVFGGAFNFIDGIVSVFVPISGRKTTNVYGLWFLPCLFWAEVLMALLLKTRKPALGFAVVTLACVAIHFAAKAVSIIPILPIALLFLMGGYYARNREDIILKIVARHKAVLCVGSAALLTICFGVNSVALKNNVDMSSMCLGLPPLYLLSCAFGTILVCMISLVIGKSKALSSVGRNSLYYYGLHFEVLSAVSKIVRGGYCKPSYHASF